MNTITQHSDVGAPYGFNENFIQPGALLRGTCNSMYTSGKETVRPVPSTINVPSGWNRILDNEKIVYISPNKSRLRSFDDVRSYMLSAATCKCGLDCPFQAEKVFSFSPNVGSTLQKVPSMNKMSCQCEVGGRFQKILSQFTADKLAKLIKKGSKKKKKKGKGFDKEGKKKVNPVRKGQKPNNIQIKPWANSNSTKKGGMIPNYNNKMTSEKELGSLINYSENTYKNNVGSYLQAQNMQTVNTVGNLTSENLDSLLNGDRLSGQGNVTNTSTENFLSAEKVADSCKANALKTSSRKGSSKSKRIPKSKEDLTIASMMGRVKQQVGDINKVRTSQMFTLPHQPTPKQEVSSAATFDKKITSSIQNTLTSTTNTPGHSFKDTTGVLNLIETKGPPNVTLPLSHSNMLPEAVTKGIRYPTASSSQNVNQISAVSFSSSQLASQQLPLRQDPQVFSGQVSTNVYWGRQDQISSKDARQQSQHELQPSVIPSNRSNTLHEVSIGEQAQGFTVTNKTVPVRSSSVVTDNVPKTEDTAQAYGEPLPKENSRPSSAMSDASVHNPIDNTSKPKEASFIGFNHENLSMQQKLSGVNAISHSLPSDKPTANKRNDRSKDIPFCEANVTNSLPSSLTKEAILPTTSAQITEKQLKDTPTSILKVPASSKSLPTQKAVTMSSPSASQPQLSDVISFQNLYGVSNQASPLKGGVATCKSGTAAGNPARFLIMGSQASQALQHLALQQNNTFQVSLQQTENPQGMYLQTFSNYNPTNHNIPHGSIGFAYANLPIQLMAIGGAQVVGKQQTAQPFSFDRYSNFYRTYQGNRQFENNANEHNAQVQATPLMYPGVNPVSQPVGSYIRIAPANAAAVATGKIPLSVQVRGTQPQSQQDVVNDDHRVQMPSSSPKTHPGTKAAATSCIASSNVRSVSTTPVCSGESTKMILVASEGAVNGKGNKPVAEDRAVSQQSSEPSNTTSPQLGISANRSLAETSQGQSEPQGSLSLQPTVSCRPPTHEVNSMVDSLPTATESKNGLKSPGVHITRQDAQRRDNETSASDSLLRLDRGGIVNQNDNRAYHEEQDELNLKCNEPCNDVSDNSRTPTPEIISKVTVKYIDGNHVESNPISVQRPSELKLGDLIWGHQKGYSAWPGKIVSEIEVKESLAENGKVWIKWFGEHTHSQMDLKSLKSLEEGLSEYRSSKRRKNRSNKKTADSLEAAIAEALAMAKTRTMPVTPENASLEFQPEAKRPKT